MGIRRKKGQIDGNDGGESAALAMEGVWFSYGGVPVLRDCCLRLEIGERAVLSGPSGCGKTTLLRLAAGLCVPERGIVARSGRISYAFQEPRLFPWLTAEENLALVLPSRRLGGRTPADWLALAGLGNAAKKYPSELSGGMGQRLNLLRALAWGGELLLLDEPFRGLDPALRRDTAVLLLEETAAAGRTLLLVSHDPGEAALLEVHRRFVLRAGAVEEV